MPGDCEKALGAGCDGYLAALALLDIQLPGMDGYDVARALRTNPTLAGTPMFHGREPDSLGPIEGLNHFVVLLLEEEGDQIAILLVALNQRYLGGHWTSLHS
jgi:CheY-like chemotaxis protein